MNTKPLFEAVVIGASAGGVRALSIVLSSLPADFRLPIIIVQHLHPHSGDGLVEVLAHKTPLHVQQADEKTIIQAGHVYLAPPNYHLLLELDGSLALTVLPKVNYARPAIDILFESAADVYDVALIGIVLTGANHDGAAGLAYIKRTGGYTIVQDPDSAEASSMPLKASQATQVDALLALSDIGPYLLQLVNYNYQKQQNTYN